MISILKTPNQALQLTTKSGAPIVALLLESTELNRYVTMLDDK